MLAGVRGRASARGALWLRLDESLRSLELRVPLLDFRVALVPPLVERSRSSWRVCRTSLPPSPLPSRSVAGHEESFHELVLPRVSVFGGQLAGLTSPLHVLQLLSDRYRIIELILRLSAYLLRRSQHSAQGVPEATPPNR